MAGTKRRFLIWWIGGLLLFAFSLFLHAPLAINGVPGGILDHQAAPDGATVTAIQSAWAEAGLSGQAKIAMISDLVFIGVFGLGCVYAGLYYRLERTSTLRALGWAALICAVVFLVSDYAETVTQFVQLMQGTGSDGLAAFASGFGPTKVFSWIGGFLTVLIALIVDRFSTNAA